MPTRMPMGPVWIYYRMIPGGTTPLLRVFGEWGDVWECAMFETDIGDDTPEYQTCPIAEATEDDAEWYWCDRGMDVRVVKADVQ